MSVCNFCLIGIPVSIGFTVNYVKEQLLDLR